MIFSKTISTTIDLEARPDHVWGALTDTTTERAWDPFFTSFDGHVVTGQSLAIVTEVTGRSFSFRPKVIEATPGRRLVWRGRLLLPGVFDGEHRFELTEPTDGTTRLEHSERFRGLLVPLTRRTVAATEAAFENFNRALRDEVARRPEPETSR